MSVRVWACPWVGTGTSDDPYRSRAQQYCTAFASFFPSNADGTPASSWVITFGRSADWTAASADAQLTDLFAGDLPGTIDSPADLRAFLRSRTIGDVPLARRQAIQANLDSLGVLRSDFTLTTPLWKVMQRVASTLFEKDANFAGGFNF
jgi:hypothetical protein